MDSGRPGKDGDVCHHGEPVTAYSVQRSAFRKTSVQRTAVDGQHSSKEDLFFPVRCTLNAERCPRRSFTLLELLIAMTILVVILTSTYTLFRSASGAFSKGEIQSQLYQQVRIVFAVMEREIASALSVPGKDLYFQGGVDNLFFICPVSEEEKADLREIGYWLSITDEILMRHVDVDPDFNFATADKDEELGVQISQLGFSFYDGEQWKASWDSRVEGKLPQAVKIELTIEDSRGTQSSDFSTIVRIETTQ